MSEFSAPSEPGVGDKITLKDHLGHLLLITVLEIVEDITTDYGDTDAIRADVAILDGPDKAKVYEDTLLFPKVLFGQLKGHVGKKVVGRLGQGEAKKGQSPPWTLAPPTDTDIVTARKYQTYINKQTAAPVDDSDAPF